MATEFNTRIKFKRDTSSNWTNKNPIILNGEIILIDTDSGELRAKIGDGSKTYTQLPFSDEVIRNLIPTDLSELNQDSTHRLVTDSEKQTWNNKSDFDGDYYSLTSRPSIPTQLSQLSSDATHRTVTDTEKSTWNNKMDELSAQTITLTTSGWTQGSDDRYYQTKSVSGITSSTPVVWVDCDLSTSDVNAKIEILTAWAGPSANEVKQGSGTLTFYSYEKPTVNIPVNVGVG